MYVLLENSRGDYLALFMWGISAFVNGAITGALRGGAWKDSVF